MSFSEAVAPHDASDAELLEALQKLARSPDEGRDRRLILDLGDMTTVSSSLVGRLLLFQRRAQELGLRFALRRVPPALQAVLEIMNLNRKLPVVP